MGLGLCAASLQHHRFRDVLCKRGIFWQPTDLGIFGVAVVIVRALGP